MNNRNSLQSRWAFSDHARAAMLGSLIADRLDADTLELGRPTFRSAFILTTLEAFATNKLQDEDQFRNLLISNTSRYPELKKAGWVKRSSTDFSTLVGLLPAGAYFGGELETLQVAPFVESDQAKIEASALLNVMLSYILEDHPTHIDFFPSFIELGNRLNDPKLHGLKDRYCNFLPTSQGPIDTDDLFLYVAWILIHSTSFNTAITGCANYPQCDDLKPIVATFYCAIKGFEALPEEWIDQIECLSEVISWIDLIHENSPQHQKHNRSTEAKYDQSIVGERRSISIINPMRQPTLEEQLTFLEKSKEGFIAQFGEDVFNRKIESLKNYYAEKYGPAGKVDLKACTEAQGDSSCKCSKRKTPRTPRKNSRAKKMAQY